MVLFGEVTTTIQEVGVLGELLFTLCQRAEGLLLKGGSYRLGDWYPLLPASPEVGLKQHGIFYLEHPSKVLQTRSSKVCFHGFFFKF